MLYRSTRSWQSRLLRLVRSRACRKPIQPIDCRTPGSLPYELWAVILSLLPCNDLVALALCNHSLRDLVGPQPFEDFSKQNALERADLFFRLDRDLPYPWIACVRCLKIHVPPPAKLHHTLELWENPALRARVEKRECFLRDKSHAAGRFFAPCFSFEQVQLAMKLHRRGGDTESYVNSLAVIRMDSSAGDQLVGLEARVRNNRFFVKRQDWFLYPSVIPQGSKANLYLGLPCVHITNDRSGICSGEKSTWDQIEKQMIEILLNMKESDYWHRHSRSQMVNTDLKRCENCATEFRLSCGPFQQQVAKYEGWYVTVLTTWMCLGEGIDPWDRYWESHLSTGFVQSRDGPRRYESEATSEAFVFEGEEFDFRSHQPTWTKAMERAHTEETKWRRRESRGKPKKALSIETEYDES